LRHTFDAIRRTTFTGRNPRTGEAIKIKASNAGIQGGSCAQGCCERGEEVIVAVAVARVTWWLQFRISANQPQNCNTISSKSHDSRTSSAPYAHIATAFAAAFAAANIQGGASRGVF